MTTLLDYLLHLDRHLDTLLLTYGTWTYAIVFLVVFAETGFVATPFLPGDSLLFALGTFAARGTLDLGVLLVGLAAAAILGDTVNYWAGYHVGPRVFRQERSRLFRREHLERTHRFYEKYGAATIILARFVPVVRTFAPFVAGIGRMTYPRFLLYNVAGGVVWVALFVVGGYLFGTLPWVERNFSVAVLLIVAASLVPLALEVWRHRRSRPAGVGEEA
ncbi:MAG: DedA family protein [Armatimonadota bacterium]|nr:DedA family protein [Armatimonadota bacterium]MDR7448240.1 DedA family protein [Armatimonadota bacterium]MDR7458271.1 DedA family protein [Armatimonadota bacterium]MDR7478426.1 DedA family protein [Armatimonadota bacterium]MDR7487360.1 DedA family protein [Armatimonadota bacterium]